MCPWGNRSVSSYVVSLLGEIFSVLGFKCCKCIGICNRPSANLGAKVPGEQVHVSETKRAYALSPQCFHSLRSCNFRPIGHTSRASC